MSLGLRTSAGETAGDSWRSAVSGADCLERLSLFESPRYGEKFAGLDKSMIDDSGRCGKILFSAVDEAMRGADISRIKKGRISVYLGTSIGGIFETENMIKNNAEKGVKNLSALSRYECSTLAELAAKRIGARGECAAFSTACSSSSLALAEGCNAVVQGDCDAALICGVDSLSRITVNGFGSLMLLSAGKCRPFDKNRDGINLGEAAGAILIVSSDFLFGQKPLAYISGWSCTCDAYHATAPHPSGEGAARAMVCALKTASLKASEISYYNAHGTATKGNDIAEAAALKSVFAENIPPVSSLKRVFGHTLGASGIVNAAMSVAAVENKTVPQNSGYEDFDAEVGIEPLAQSRACDVENVLSVSLGFGGNNGAVVVSKNAQNASANFGKRRLFVFGRSILGNGSAYDDAELLKDVPPLKKRKFAHLQKMGLETAAQAVAQADSAADANRISVCWGTGLGMTSQTRAFIENVFEKKEAEPMPTAFTNSVHNAVPSAIAVRWGFKGLNSAVTAKEISFECALAQAKREINSFAADAAVVCAGDEYNSYAADFLDSSHAKYSDTGGKRLSDFAAAYFVGAENSARAKPLFEILSLDIRRASKSVGEECAAIAELLERSGVAKGGVSRWFSSKGANGYQRKFLKSLADKIGASFTNPPSKYGDNYCLSASVFCECAGRTGDICLQYTLSSTSMRAVTLFKVL